MTRASWNHLIDVDKRVSLSLSIYISLSIQLCLSRTTKVGLFWATGPPKGKSHQIIYQVSPPRSQRRSASPGLWMIKLAPLDRVWMSLGGLAACITPPPVVQQTDDTKQVFGHVFVSEQKCSHHDIFKYLLYPWIIVTSYLTSTTHWCHRVRTQQRPMIPMHL